MDERPDTSAPLAASGAAAAIDSPDAIAHDVAVVGRLEAVPRLLELLCTVTGMGFAAVARVTDATWTACAIHDNIEFGMTPGGQLDLRSTLCFESRAANAPITIDHASVDPHYCGHHTPKLYRIESYVSVPIVLPSGRYFGNLCAIDPAPAQVSDPKTLAIFQGLAGVIALQLESELEREQDKSALRDAKAASELREQFIAILGHDLRNPLHAVHIASHLLERRLSDPALANMATRIKVNAQRMSRLIDDVLDFARARLGGGIGVEVKSVADLQGALLSVVQEFREGQPDRQILSSISLDGPVFCDEHRLQQVLSNLIGNAVTHGAAQSPISVAVNVSDDHLIVQVHNEGEPITEESRRRIFEPFWRRSTAADRQGLGLGLHICAQIARAHGGEITVWSTTSAGTTFTVRIPQPIGDYIAGHTVALREGI